MSREKKSESFTKYANAMSSLGKAAIKASKAMEKFYKAYGETE